MSQLVEEAARRYNELVLGPYLDATREHLARAVEAEPITSACRVLRPYFVDVPTYEQSVEATRLVDEGLRVAAERLLVDRGLREEVGFPDYVDLILELDRERGRPSVTARMDGLFDGRGRLELIEYNSLPDFGPAHVINDMFGAAPATAEFRKAFRFREQHHYDDALEALRLETGLPPGAELVVALPEGRSDAWLDYTVKEGHRVTFAPFSRFHFDGRRLVVEEGGAWPVDTILIDWEDVLCPTEEMDGIMAALAAGAVRPLGGLSRGFLCSYKHTFELLSDPAHRSMFREPVAAALARHVPWTRVVRERKTTFGAEKVDLVPFVADHRQRLVLKPSGGAQGQDVVIGPLVSDDVWAKALRRALEQQFVVQEWVPCEVADYPLVDGRSVSLVNMSSGYDMFVWAGKDVRGCQSRLTTSGIHNVASGATLTGAWIIESRVP